MLTLTNLALAESFGRIATLEKEKLYDELISSDSANSDLNRVIGTHNEIGSLVGRHVAAKQTFKSLAAFRKLGLGWKEITLETVFNGEFS